MATDVSPPLSSSSSPSSLKRRHSPSLSLDLSDLPALSQPSRPSNTLLITNLNDPLIFTAQNLQAIKTAINDQAPLHTFSPLRSFRRIIAVFQTVEASTQIRKQLDGETVLGHRIRVYFGEPTTLEEKDQHLAAPKSQKLFFISPPPSPPMGWEMRNEEPPNKEVHAADLASALSKLHADERLSNAQVLGNSGGGVDGGAEWPPSPRSAGADGASGLGGQRSRSSTIVFDPSDHGGSLHLPAISVEDTSDGEDDGAAGLGAAEMENKPVVHTARPPVELME